MRTLSVPFIGECACGPPLQCLGHCFCTLQKCSLCWLCLPCILLATFATTLQGSLLGHCLATCHAWMVCDDQMGSCRFMKKGSCLLALVWPHLLCVLLGGVREFTLRPSVRALCVATSRWLSGNDMNMCVYLEREYTFPATQGCCRCCQDMP